MSEDPVDYKALFLQAEEARKQAEEDREREESLRKHEQEQTRRTTFREFIQYCHALRSLPLRAGHPAESTTGEIPQPTGKYCPLRLEPWTDCDARQQEIYNAVCHYLLPLGRDPPRLFSSRHALEEDNRRFSNRPITSEKDLEYHERSAVESQVQDIIAALSKIPAARDEFGLGDGLLFDSHTNGLDEIMPEEHHAGSSPYNGNSRPDQYCIHRVHGNTKAILTTVEYKPPHKLSIENLRAGLRPMNFYEEIVETETIPVSGPEKLSFNAARLAGSAIVQEYHVMIQEGLEYSYLTTGLGIVLLRIPDDCGILYYRLCEPNLDVGAGGDGQVPWTAIGRVLCLCLMSFRSHCRDQVWRNAARARLPKWETGFSHERAQIPTNELRMKPPGSDYISLDGTSSEVTPSEYQPSSPIESPVSQGRRVPTRAFTSCAPTGDAYRREDSPGSDSDPTAATQRKRGFSQIASSPPTQRSAPTTPQKSSQYRAGQRRPHDHDFCTQKCLLSLQRDAALDTSCPNVELHRAGQDIDHHPIRAAKLVQMIKQQLDKNLDELCTPIGQRGSYGAPFKITSAEYGYTVVGKGTTSRRWPVVSREAEIYQILQSVQGSAVPVFLGPIDLDMVYFLHGAGEIRHMLLMGWGGENVRRLMENNPTIQRAISRSERKILSLGVVHDDLRLENILWNEELQRALIIDFHRCHLNNRLIRPKSRSVKRISNGAEDQISKRARPI
ncbi:hypothetical protein BO79DRAFT_82035 [Aspergillus costaricaensis CBS 115574]|uniref:Uncharacterized protein n=1 Tax=Aspergillus costaricaensis CBS 115574 TaxID=1448317 RepID=A0ACD1ILA6_9EURO|nr:hypothetical protein BO79DRAFT_82035 [Aspergillus costaricaensis CBS 115574]RAK90890.1 hypothetical protein BO79DRAFT_82035 [Aspergillus costaricaensis CBS 115574]